MKMPQFSMVRVQQTKKPQRREVLTRALESGLDEPLAADAKGVLAELKD